MFPFYLLIGWLLYLVRVLREVDVVWPIAALASLVAGGLLIGLGWFKPSAWHTRWRRPFALIGLLLLLPVVGVAMNDAIFQGALLSTMNERVFVSQGLAAARTQSANNLKQICLAVHSYHDDNKHLPPGGTFDPQGRGLHSWQAFLLPYCDEQALFRRIDLQQPWNAPANAEVMKQRVSPFENPGIENPPRGEFSLSHYAGNVHVLGPTQRTIGDITDGTSNTMLAGEVTHNFKPWGMPGNWRDPALGIHQSPDGFGGPHKNLTMIVMCDGSVRAVPRNVSPAVMKAIATPSGGEPLNPYDLD